jgi:LuxR family transcriptional regulator, maltose regulon positive regulatory protein
VWIAQGRFDDALGWARDRGLPVEGEPPYLREFEHVTVARALLAWHAETGDAGALDDAMRLLHRLLDAAVAGGRTGSVVELRLLHALARQARGDRPGALDVLARALVAGEPEGYVRLFVEAGSSVAPLLGALSRQGDTQAYARRLLAAVPAADDGEPAAQGLVDPLSARELEVLRLLGTDLDGPAIARELFVSLNTVRTHTKNIYAKLGVTSRRAAVRRAAELDLPARTRPR